MLWVTWRHRRDAIEVHWSPLLGMQSNKEGSMVPPAHSSPHIEAPLPVTSGSRGQHWDFTALEPHGSLCLFAGLVPWDWTNKTTGVVPIFPGNTGHFLPPCGKLKSQRSARELKNVSVYYTSIRSKHRWLDREGIHQIP